MRFKVYSIKETKNGYKNIQLKAIEGFFEALNQLPKIDDNDETYAAMYFKKHYNLVLGTLVQSYGIVLTKFDSSNEKREIELDDNEINDKTYFYIDIDNDRIFIQNKNYPGDLNRGLAIERIEKLLATALKKQLSLVPAEFYYGIDEIERLFKTANVKSIKFSNMIGLKLPIGSVLHNPRIDLDGSVVESYNTYSANEINSMEFKSKTGKKLTKNPFAKIGIVLSKEYPDHEIFRQMEILDVDTNEKVSIRHKGNDSKIINIGKFEREDTQVAYQKIIRANFPNEED